MKEYFYNFGNCTVKVTRPDISEEERKTRIEGALTRFYRNCLADGVDISEKQSKRKSPLEGGASKGL